MVEIGEQASLAFGSESYFHHCYHVALGVWLTSLCLCYLICKTETISGPHSIGVGTKRFKYIKCFKPRESLQNASALTPQTSPGDFVEGEEEGPCPPACPSFTLCPLRAAPAQELLASCLQLLSGERTPVWAIRPPLVTSPWPLSGLWPPQLSSSQPQVPSVLPSGHSVPLKPLAFALAPTETHSGPVGLGWGMKGPAWVLGEAHFELGCPGHQQAPLIL